MEIEGNVNAAILGVPQTNTTHNNFSFGLAEGARHTRVVFTQTHLNVSLN